MLGSFIDQFYYDRLWVTYSSFSNFHAMGWKSVLLKLVKLRHWFRVGKLYFASNLFSCFVFPHRRFHYHHYPGSEYHYPGSEYRRVRKYKPNTPKDSKKVTRVLRPRLTNQRKTVPRSSPINVADRVNKLKRRKRKSPSDFEKLGLYDLEYFDTGGELCHIWGRPKLWVSNLREGCLYKT